MTTEKLNEIQRRLAKVCNGKWKFNPKHEMFIGTTNAIEMYDRTLDLGRDNKEYVAYSDDMGQGWKLTPQAKRQYETTLALGEFLESCREDMQGLLNEIVRMQEREDYHLRAVNGL
jgi:hypothetical protein